MEELETFLAHKYVDSNLDAIFVFFGLIFVIFGQFSSLSAIARSGKRGPS